MTGIHPVRGLLLVLLLGCSSALVHGHPPMGNDCAAPVRPVDDQNDQLWAQFLAEIDTYQTCISREADRHQAASDAHQRAAFAAVDAWNDFVRSSLNVPEDFPWPPSEE